MATKAFGTPLTVRRRTLTNIHSVDVNIVSRITDPCSSEESKTIYNT